MFAATPRTRLTPVTISTLLALAIACRGGDGSRTTTVAVGASVDTSRPSATGTTKATTAPAKVAAPVTYESAEAAYSAGRYPEAVELFTTYTERKPENPWGFY